MNLFPSSEDLINAADNRFQALCEGRLRRPHWPKWRAFYLGFLEGWASDHEAKQEALRLIDDMLAVYEKDTLVTAERMEQWRAVRSKIAPNR
jgi:hypothetical protein